MFVPDDWFGEIIIILNKKNINRSASTKSEEFFCKTMSQNMLSLYNSKKDFLQATWSTKYSNCHLIVDSYLVICYFIKFLTKEAVFYEQLGWGNSRSDLPNLFTNSHSSLAKGVLLSEYITNSQDNQVAATRLQKDNNENDLAARDDNVNTKMVEKRVKEIEIDYN